MSGAAAAPEERAMDRRGAAQAGMLLLLPLAAPGEAAAQSGFVLPRTELLRPDCGRASSNEIVVCGHGVEEPRSRYRLPEEPDRGFDPADDIDSVSRERNRLMEPGASGTGSCSPAGSGGWSGCMANDFRHQIDQYGGRPPSARNG
jgi:hypothetical protein